MRNLWYINHLDEACSQPIESNMLYDLAERAVVQVLVLHESSQVLRDVQNTHNFGNGIPFRVSDLWRISMHTRVQAKQTI